MSKFQRLAVLPIAWAAVFLALDAAFYGGPAYGTFVRTEVEAAKALTLIGSWAAALAFEKGAYQRRAWFFIGGCMALLLCRDLVTLTPVFRGLGAHGVNVVAGILVLSANVSQVIGTWMLARTWKVAELELPGSRAAQLATVGVVGVLAAVFAGPSVVLSGNAVLAGDLTRASGVASGLGDMISLWLIAPLLLTALALRGGLFGWPFSLLTASYVAWLGYDALAILGPVMGLGPHASRTGAELFRALGCLFGFSAGMAQRAVVHGLRALVNRRDPAAARGLAPGADVG
jgi:hypothetical protein